MSEKIIGYILLGVGLFVIFYSGFSIYRVFTKRAEPISFFNFSGIQIDPSQLVDTETPEKLPKEAEVLLEKRKQELKPTEIVPSELINDSSNLIVHILLMGFFVNVGYRLAMIGASLARPIVVKNKIHSNPQNKQ